MTKPHKIHWALCLFVFFLSSLLAGCTGEYERLKREQFPYVFSVAEQLGYTPDILLAQGEQCSFGTFTTSVCNLFVVYKTPLSVSEFGALLPQLELKQVGYELGSSRTLFTVMNNHTKHKLTVSGNDGSTVEKILKLPDFPMYDWHFINEQEKNLIIEFYESAELTPPLDLDSYPIQSNIVIVTYQLGIVRH